MHPSPFFAINMSPLRLPRVGPHTLDLPALTMGRPFSCGADSSFRLHSLLHFFSLFVFAFAMSLPVAPIALAKADGQCQSGSGLVVPTTPLVAFLERVQETALEAFGSKAFDPKLYVDLPLKQDLVATEKAFDALRRSSSLSAATLQRFINDYLGKAGSDLVPYQPEDFKPEPEGFLPKVQNPKLRKWALEVHSLWTNLSRKASVEVYEKPERHTLLPFNHTGIIAGSRFREIYYWDSYWVIKGLMASKMYKTAKEIVLNLIDMIHKYQHVLNGARAYYTNRSQPPLLSAMIREIYNRTSDVELVKTALPALLKEYQFWNSDIHQVKIEDSHGCTHVLNRYYAKWNKPRPESGTTDKESARNISNVSEKEKFFREVATTAESGWDFSTRWMRNETEFTTLTTTSILPVDLNVFILRMELDIAFMAKVTGKNQIARQFSEASFARKKAIQSIFWNENKSQWFDYWLNDVTICKETHKWKASNQNQKIYASNFIPLWIELFNSDSALVEKVVRSFKNSGLLQANGIATSLKYSGQQWDFPNGWPPVQDPIVTGLAESGLKDARSLAEEIAIRWIRTNYVSFKQTGFMHEKMNVTKCGDFGGGGEYVSQTGFGWSNGVVLTFLERFGWPKGLKIECD